MMKPFDIYADGILLGETGAETESEALDKACGYAARAYPKRTQVVAVFEQGKESGIIRRIFPRHHAPPVIVGPNLVPDSEGGGR